MAMPSHVTVCSHEFKNTRQKEEIQSCVLTTQNSNLLSPVEQGLQDEAFVQMKSNDPSQGNI